MFLTQFLARCDGYPVLCILKISANQQGNASEVSVNLTSVTSLYCTMHKWPSILSSSYAVSLKTSAFWRKACNVSLAGCGYLVLLYLNSVDDQVECLKFL